MAAGKRKRSEVRGRGRGGNSDAQARLKQHQIADRPPIYAIGNFDDRVTVLTQQHRALNLAWALIESGRLPMAPDQERCRIAVLGGGFAGLTFAAALINKNARCTISIFEERDTLLPLQQGSDTRWLHPHIYDWPAPGSEAVAAMLPILNWTAGRASDVVVEALAGWSDVVEGRTGGTKVELWCNTRHIQLRERDNGNALIEWVGESRDVATGRAAARPTTVGRSAEFDVVIVAVGFGIEPGGRSYWRNEVLAQPGLEHHASTYLVSGQGDGAMIDLLRLKISQFRQDRILSELFGKRAELVAELRGLRTRFLNDPSLSLYEAFDDLTGRRTVAGRQMVDARRALTLRLRRDTQVILQTKPTVRSIGDLLGPDVVRTSFQNALLVYLLYRCGGFTPAAGDTDEVAERFKVAEPFIIRRHGVDRLGQLKRLLPERLFAPIQEAWEADGCRAWRQPSNIAWQGGYFGTPGRASDFDKLNSADKAVARKEYLPGPTALMAASIAGAIAGHLLALRPGTSHLRLTIHRVIEIHGEALLQQACNYVGVGPLDQARTIARTFPADNATIGQAYRTRRTIRIGPEVPRRELDAAMRKLRLNNASRAMARDVRFVAAMPLLQPSQEFFAPSPVCAILYFDSRDENFNLTEHEFVQLGHLLAQTFEAARDARETGLHRVDNTPLHGLMTAAPPALALDPGVARELTLVAAPPPELKRRFVLNFDHSDLTPLAN
ncbi:NAD(P)/FAD-dependent oxidoreductase [Sphingomonas parva]|uniref:NAD(P)/FAD-dependent oxidoreductase n=1 Tax=Sphingomonas parva TaxID=2555898 RepID=A0A4Y8ZRG1_9SPHN|nr:FAD/NAD(P)-binding protein [Sphingomonas parva]TFI58620.1 NAD(P)/FAD-dependent oxidoreductase [Sphingomonas parva]